MINNVNFMNMPCINLSFIQTARKAIEPIIPQSTNKTWNGRAAKPITNYPLLAAVVLVVVAIASTIYYIYKNYKEEPATTRTVTTIGLQNVGNTCYINSAMQPLLAIKNFPQLVPDQISQNTDESDESYEGRQQILTSFKTFLNAWSKQSSPSELGFLIGQLRKTIFKAGLLEGGFSSEPQDTNSFFGSISSAIAKFFEGGIFDFSNETSYQDTGSFFDLILHVIGQDFQMKNSKTFAVGDKNKYEINRTHQERALLLKKTDGSIQDKIDDYSTPLLDYLEEEYAIKHDSGKKLTRFLETNQIIGDPQELLIVRVEKHEVNPENDRYIDCTGLFKENVTGQANYKLVGFAQNHNQIHWTSVVYKGKDKWDHCNDDVVTSVKSTDHKFQYPANYMIYKKRLSK